eukprot:PITA_29882
MNIGTKEKPKLTSIGDYYDDQTTREIFDMLKEYEDLFPCSFSELKGIKGDLGEMKIALRPNVKLVKHQSYRLNLRVKEKDTKDSYEIWVCVDYCNLNNARVHDPFPTPFNDEVLDNVGGNEAYSFTDGFSGYHQVRIAEEDKDKNTFTTEWGLYAYNVMPFGLNNDPVVFSHIVIVDFREYIQKFLEVYMDDWTI